MRTTSSLVASLLLSACCCLGMPTEPMAPAAPSVPTGPTVPLADADPTYIASFCSTPGRACPLLAEVAAAGPFVGCAGPANYLGVMYPVGGIPNDGVEVPFFLQVRAEPSGCAAAARTLIAESPEEAADIAAVLTALRAGQPPPAGSGAVDYARTAPPPSGYHPLEPTTGVSTALLGPTTIFVRSSGTRLLFVQQGDIHYDRPNIVAPYAVGELWALP